MHRLVLLCLLVSFVIAGVWYALARPERVPPSPLAAGEKVSCISYAPFHGEQAPYDRSLRVPDAQIAADLEQLSPVTSCVRTYSAAKAQAKITRLAGRYNLKVLQGIWLGRDRTENRREIEAALRLAERHPGVVEAFIVGNEALLRGELSPADIKDYLQEVRRRGGLPVTYADVWEFWLKAPELADAVDFVTIHILPYWEDDPVRAGDAVAHVGDIRAKLAETFPGKDILIGEVGWPSQGRMRAGALPSPVNQARVLAGVVALAKDQGWKVNLIEAYDQPWKRLLEGTVGGYWGLFDDTVRAPKFRWGESLSNHPRWRLEASLGIAVAILVFAAGWLGCRKQAAPATPDFAVAAIALGAGVVFGQAVVEYPMGPPELGDRLRDLALIGLAAVVPAVASFALASRTRLPSISLGVNPALWRRAGRTSVLLALLLIATVIAATHVALGLVFDPRYKDFLFASLTGPVAALALLAFASNGRPAHRAGDDAAEIAVGSLLALCALFIIYNEGVANWQALWLAGLLLVLSLTVLRARAFDWSRAALRPGPRLRAQPAPD
jgi:glucan 1,3-beta-glucosidase